MSSNQSKTDKPPTDQQPPPPLKLNPMRKTTNRQQSMLEVTKDSLGEIEKDPTKSVFINTRQELSVQPNMMGTKMSHFSQQIDGLSDVHPKRLSKKKQPKFLSKYLQKKSHKPKKPRRETAKKKVTLEDGTENEITVYVDTGEEVKEEDKEILEEDEASEDEAADLYEQLDSQQMEATFAKKYDLFKLDNKMMTFIRERMEPIMALQKDQVYMIDENRNNWLALDQNLSKSVEEFSRATKAMGDFKEMDKKVNSYTAKIASVEKRLFDDHQEVQKAQKILNVELKKINRKVEQLDVTLKAVKRKEESLDEASRKINNFQEDTYAFIDKQVQQMLSHMDVKEMHYLDMKDKLASLEGDIDVSKEFIQNIDIKTKKFEKDMSETLKKMMFIKNHTDDIQHFRGRIEFLENEQRQIRLMTERMVEETKDSLKKTINQSQCEATVMKFQFHMMESTLKKLEKESVRNFSIQDQLRIDFKQWKYNITEMYGKVKDETTETLENFKLENAKQERANLFKFMLETRFLKPKSKYDDFGYIRCNSLEHTTDKLLNLDPELTSKKGGNAADLDGAKPKKARQAPGSARRRVSKIEAAPVAGGASGGPSRRQSIVKSKLPPLFVPYNQVIEQQEMVMKRGHPGIHGSPGPHGGIQGQMGHHTGGPNTNSTHPADAGQVKKGASFMKSGFQNTTMPRGGLGPRVKNRTERKVKPEDLIHWGRIEMMKYPLAPKGLQIVDMNNLVDLQDLELFKNRLSKEVEFSNHKKFEEFDDYLKEELSTQKEELDGVVGQAEENLRKEVQKVVDYDLSNLDRLTQRRQEFLKQQFERQIEDLDASVVDRFLEQKQWNKECLDKLRFQDRKLREKEADLKQADRDLRGTQETILQQQDFTNQEIVKTLDVLNSVLELQFLSQVLEFQDEIDRHQMSLWAINPQVTPDGKIKHQKHQEPPLKVDDQCVSCSLEKFRPMIKEAYKMACIQYKPQPVAFNGVQYDRRSLINMKRAMIEDLCTHKLYKNELYIQYLDQRKEMNDPSPINLGSFFGGIQQKLVEFGQKVKEGGRLDLDIEEMVLNEELKKQIIKNPTSQGLLYELSGDKTIINKYLNEIKKLQVDDESIKLNPLIQNSNTIYCPSSDTATARSKEEDPKVRKQKKLRKIELKSRAIAQNEARQETLEDTTEKESRSSTTRQQIKLHLEAASREATPDEDDIYINSIQIPKGDNNFAKTGQYTVEQKKLNGSEDDETYEKVKIELAKTSKLKLDISKDGESSSHRAPSTLKENNYGNVGPFKRSLKQSPTKPLAKSPSKSPLKKSLKRKTTALINKDRLDTRAVSSILDSSARASINQDQSRVVLPPRVENAKYSSMKQTSKHQFLQESTQKRMDDYFSRVQKNHEKPWPKARSPNEESTNLLPMPTVNLNKNLPNVESIQKLRSNANQSQDTAALQSHSRLLISGLTPQNRSLAKINAQTQQTSPKQSSEAQQQPHSVAMPEIFSTKSSQVQFDFSKTMITKQTGRNVKEALANISLSQKSQLLDKMLERNRANKRIDNYTIITGITHSKDTKKQLEKFEEENPIVQISALSPAQARGHGVGYMYSKGLLNDLQSPTDKNQSLTKALKIHQMYEQKSKDISQASGEKILESLRNNHSELFQKSTNVIRNIPYEIKRKSDFPSYNLSQDTIHDSQQSTESRQLLPNAINATLNKSHQNLPALQRISHLTGLAVGLNENRSQLQLQSTTNAELSTNLGFGGKMFFKPTKKRLRQFTSTNNSQANSTERKKANQAKYNSTTMSRALPIEATSVEYDRKKNPPKPDLPQEDSTRQVTGEDSIDVNRRSLMQQSINFKDQPLDLKKAYSPRMSKMSKKSNGSKSPNHQRDPYRLTQGAIRKKKNDKASDYSAWIGGSSSKDKEVSIPNNTLNSYSKNQQMMRSSHKSTSSKGGQGTAVDKAPRRSIDSRQFEITVKSTQINAIKNDLKKFQMKKTSPGPTQHNNRDLQKYDIDQEIQMLEAGHASVGEETRTEDPLSGRSEQVVIREN